VTCSCALLLLWMSVCLSYLPLHENKAVHKTAVPTISNTISAVVAAGAAASTMSVALAVAVAVAAAART
jgi:hypothetical protein